MNGELVGQWLFYDKLRFRLQQGPGETDTIPIPARAAGIKALQHLRN